MIKFCEQISIANVTRCWGALCTCARANWKGTFVVKLSLMLKLPKWYIYDFGPRHSARTAGQIGTGEAPIDAPIRRNDDGADPGSINSTWHVARAAA